MLARTEAALVAPARSAARAVAAARVAHAGILFAAFSLPLSTDLPEYGGLVSILALVAARAAGLPAHRRSPFDLPVALAIGATLAALALALATGVPPPAFEPATRVRACLGPVVIVSALSLPLPGDGADAPRDRAVRALLAWCLSALVASAVGVTQATAGIDPLFALGLRRVERLVPVPGWPGHFAATGFYSGYARFGQHLLAPLLLAASLAVSGGLAPRRRLLLAAAAAAATAGVVASALRIGWASLAVGALTLALLGGRRALRAGLPLLAGAVGLALLHPGLRLRLAALAAGEGNGDRQTIWRVCSAIARDHPLGIGPGNFEHVAPGYWARLAPGTEVGSGCHAVPFHLLVEGGPLLLAASAVAAVLVVRPFWSAARDASRDALARAAASGALAGMAALAANALVHDLHRAVQVAYSATVTVGLAAVLALPPARPERGGGGAPSSRDGATRAAGG